MIQGRRRALPHIESISTTMRSIAGRQLTSHPFSTLFVGNLLWVSHFSVCPHQIIDESSENRCLAPRQSKCVSYQVKRYTFSQLEEAMTPTEDGDKELINIALARSITRSIPWQPAQQQLQIRTSPLVWPNPHANGTLHREQNKHAT
jgi:hypothetical protein